MVYRSKAPLRIGLAGGGTDVSPFCDLYGGAILNATISLYAHATIEPLDENKIILHASDRNESEEFEFANELPLKFGPFNAKKISPGFNFLVSV